MASETSICNQALRKLGANPILDINQNTPEAGLCKEFYFDVRDSLLEDYPWTFATKRYKLPKSGEMAPEPFSAQFLIPADVLRVVQASDNPDFTKINSLDWVVENGFILANASNLYIQTIVSKFDVKALSSKFIRAFVARLAAELSLPITQSREMHRQFMEEFGILMMSAQSADGQQGRSRRYRSSQLTEVRAAGSSYAGPTV